MKPTSHNIAILGAGIMGLCAAHALLKSGHTITIYDGAGFPANNASAKAGGMLAPFAEIDHMRTEWITAGLTGIDFWSGFADNHNIGFQQNGSLLIAHEPDRYALDRFKGLLEDLPSEYQEYWSITDPEDHEPTLKKFTYALSLMHEAHLNPSATIFELCKINKEIGAVFLQENMELEAAQKNHDLVIDCRGMGATKSDSSLRGIKGEIVTVQNEEFQLSRPVRLMHPRYPLYIVPRDDGIFTIGATQIESGENTNVNLRSAMELLSAAYSLHPSFGDAEILEITSGIRPTYPDNLPRITREGNIISANGLFRHGYLLAPIMADCLAAQISGTTTSFSHLFAGERNEPHHQRAA